MRSQTFKASSLSSCSSKHHSRSSSSRTTAQSFTARSFSFLSCIALFLASAAGSGGSGGIYRGPLIPQDTVNCVKPKTSKIYKKFFTFRTYKSKWRILGIKYNKYWVILSVNNLLDHHNADNLHQPIIWIKNISIVAVLVSFLFDSKRMHSSAVTA